MFFWLPFLHLPGEQKTNPYRNVFGVRLDPPPRRHWAFSQESLDKAIEEERVRLICKNCGYSQYKGKWLGCPKCGKKEAEPQIFNIWDLLSTNWTDILSYSQAHHFLTENSEILLKRVIESTSNKSDMIMDFFLGIGTTTAVAHKLKRKWIGVEMADYFVEFYYDYDGNKRVGFLGRMKQVLAGERSGISKEIKWKGGGFFKYFEVEQFEDTLRKVKYRDTDPFLALGEDPYNQYIFLKDLRLLEALEIDYKENKVKVDLSKLYKDIDIPETLSCLLGKPIKKITADEVEFADGEKMNFKNLDYKLIKPLIWWEA